MRRIHADRAAYFARGGFPDYVDFFRFHASIRYKVSSTSISSAIGASRPSTLSAISFVRSRNLVRVSITFRLSFAMRAAKSASLGIGSNTSKSLLSRVEIFSARGHSRLSQGRLKGAQISQPTRTTGLLDDAAVEVEYFTEPQKPH